MRKYQAVPRKTLLASALILAATGPAWAQQATTAAVPGQAPDPATLDTVTVTGIRGSLTSSMNLKRDSQGVVDGIVAEDIGKFPDTNLAESLQRISGVSIDRTSSGEGSKVTVRGIGPDFNLVLLNGRQMPSANLGSGGAGVSSSRSFDFANLASESISAVEVYKTTRADNPTGGIGATINVKTLRPLDAEPVVSIGMKAVSDSSNDNLPRTMKGSGVTGELSGVFSDTWADGRFGLMLSGSHQERDSGFNQATVAEGWATFRGNEATDGRALPLPGTGYADRIQNRPGPDDIYGRPQNTAYNVNAVQRQRTNAQATLQWKPADNVTTTLDYTWIENKVQQQRSELSVWFNYGPGDSIWTNGPVAAPIIYSEDMVNSDLAMGGASLATRNTMDSLGFNVEWEVNDALDLAFDYHTSSGEAQPDGPYGSAGVLGVAAFVRGTTTVDYSGDLPIINVQMPPGRQVEPSDALVTGSVFQNSYNKSEVDQYQARGQFRFADYQALDFGIGFTEVNNRSASAINQRDSWGGLGTPADYDDSIWYADDMGRYFDAFSGHDDPRLTGRFLVFDFDRLRDRAAQVGNAANPACPTCYVMPTEYTEDIRTTEKSRSAYLQWRNTFDWSMPLHVAVGVRYEDTEVTSNALVRVPNGISWGSANEFNITYAGEPGFISGTGEYDYVLPNVDLKLDINESLALRGSYSRSIGRPGWSAIQSGQSLAAIVRTNGGTGSRGNPGLEPLLSDNFDLSLEWYYGESSYASVGFFRKNIKNFISDTILREQPGNLHTPVGGAYWNAALGSCPASDLPCIRNYIFSNFNGSPGVTATGTDSAGQLTGTIVGQPGDPVAGFDITVPANQRSDHLDGWEVSLQHLFGQSGFGVAANYTKVKSGLTFDDRSLGDQYPMTGLSDSANFVAFYDRNAWQVRAAYNWRDKFFSGIGGQGPNPNYTDAYGQFDLNISYAVTDQLTLSLEGINLTDETMRTYARHSNMLRYATQTGPRYMFGLRYRF